MIEGLNLFRLLDVICSCGKKVVNKSKSRLHDKLIVYCICFADHATGLSLSWNPRPPPISRLVRLQQVPESFIRERMNSIDIGRGVDIPYMEEALAVILGER